jgi:hypothetical protein
MHQVKLDVLNNQIAVIKSLISLFLLNVYSHWLNFSIHEKEGEQEVYG